MRTITRGGRITAVTGRWRAAVDFDSQRKNSLSVERMSVVSVVDRLPIRVHRADGVVELRVAPVGVGEDLDGLRVAFAAQRCRPVCRASAVRIRTCLSASGAPSAPPRRPRRGSCFACRSRSVRMRLNTFSSFFSGRSARLMRTSITSNAVGARLLVARGRDLASCSVGALARSRSRAACGARASRGGPSRRCRRGATARRPRCARCGRTGAGRRCASASSCRRRAAACPSVRISFGDAS